MGDKVDLACMMKSSAPNGTYLFRPAADSVGSRNLTLCVLDGKENGDRTYKKFRVLVVEKSDSRTVYTITLSSDREEIFPTLTGLVEKHRLLLNLGDNFMEWEERQRAKPGSNSEADGTKVRKKPFSFRLGPVRVSF